MKRDDVGLSGSTITMIPGQVDDLWLWVRRWLERLGPEGSPTHWASMSGCCSGGGGSTGFAQQMFLLCLSSAPLLSGMGTCEDFAMPGCVVGSNLLPIASVNAEILEGSFEAVFVAFRLPSN